MLLARVLTWLRVAWPGPYPPPCPDARGTTLFLEDLVISSAFPLAPLALISEQAQRILGTRSCDHLWSVAAVGCKKVSHGMD